jgi:hypothetical protein
MRTAEVVNKEREEKRKFNRDKRTEAGIGNSLYSGSLIKKKKGTLWLNAMWQQKRTRQFFSQL